MHRDRLTILCLAVLVAGCTGAPQPEITSTAAGASPTTISVATFNVEQFTDDTGKDFAALATICERYDIIAIQEVKKTGAAVDRLCRILGSTWAYELGDVTGNAERFAYLYRKDRIEYRGRKGWIAVDGQNPQISRVPFYAYFKSGDFDFILVTVHLFYSDDRRRADEIDQLIAWYRYFIAKSPEKDVIFLGDFNEKRKHPLFAKFSASGVLKVVTAGIPATNLSDTEDFDHVVINEGYTREFGGRVETFMFDEILFGNDDTKAQKAVSNHRPVIATFRTDLPDDD